MDHCKWRKVIKEARWSGWVWVGECFFWYRPTRVVPDQRPLKKVVVVVVLPLVYYHCYSSVGVCCCSAWVKETWWAAQISCTSSPRICRRLGLRASGHRQVTSQSQSSDQTSAFLCPVSSATSSLSYVCHFYASMRLPHISRIVAFFAYFSNVCILHIFLHKSTFSKAILIFLFPLDTPVLCEYAIAACFAYCHIFLHISAKCTYRIFSCINWHFRRQFWCYLRFCYLFLLGFLTSTTWLPTE